MYRVMYTGSECTVWGSVVVINRHIGHSTGIVGIPLVLNLHSTGIVGILLVLNRHSTCSRHSAGIVGIVGTVQA